jgi:hypothetical protein
MIKAGYPTLNKNNEYDYFLFMLIKVQYCSCVSFFKSLYSILLGSQWGWLPYDIAPTEILPYVCEVPIRETYGIMDDYRSIGII